MQDSPEILEKAANYLRSYEEPEILDDVLGF